MSGTVMLLNEDLSALKPQAMTCARRLADWIVNTQTKDEDCVADSGNFPFIVSKDGVPRAANNWNHAFAIMGLLAAGQVFGEERYTNAAVRMGRYLGTLQIFDPFHRKHYGAFREMTAQTPWCYVRDALSAAWAMAELYRCTGKAEYLERAKLWEEWFQREGMDETGWPWWGIMFDEAFPVCLGNMRNDVHGCFHGGGLNFFYLMYRITGDRRYVGGFYEAIADRFISEIQQADGLFRSTLAATGKVPETDPQNGLHRANDDLGTLGLLGAYRVYGKAGYRDAIGRFLDCVFAAQRDDGMFEDSCAATPVVLNIVSEAAGTVGPGTARPGAASRALEALFRRQIDRPGDLWLDGGLDETGNGECCARSICYSLIVLLKLFGNSGEFLSVR